MPAARKNKLLSQSIKDGLDKMKASNMDYVTEKVTYNNKEDKCLQYFKLAAFGFLMLSMF